MDEATARTLNRINRSFYRSQAKAFSQTREAPWPGWHRLLEVIDAGGRGNGLALLDVGCGNGRLGRFLAARVAGLRYTGLDASAELLALAREEGGLGREPRLLQADLVEDDWSERLGPQRFNLVACIGLLHHLPGRERRRQLLAELLRRLQPGGYLAVSCWQLGRFASFRDKILPWRGAETEVDPAQLEPGDHLLPWGRGEGLRYVHFAHEEETAELLAGLACEPVASWTADGRSGRSNRYLVVRA